MSAADEYRRYAEEALLWARKSKTDDDRAILLYLARIWMSAAREEGVVQRAALAGGLPSHQRVNTIVHFPKPPGHFRGPHAAY
jgi:hypothetical protein